jgi:hypothetical protein
MSLISSDHGRNTCTVPTAFMEGQAVIQLARQKTADHPTYGLSRPLETLAQEETLFGSLSPVDTGMMVLSSSMRILHMNGQARVLMAHLGVACELWPHLSPESMPAILIEFCGHVLSELRRQAGSQQWTALEMRRVCHMVTPALLLRGFGMPETDGWDPRMILILQPCHS